MILLVLLFSYIIPLDHFSYPILERFETEGILTLPYIKPYYREDIVKILKRVDTNKLSRKDSYLFSKLRREFIEESHILYHKDPKLSYGFSPETFILYEKGGKFFSSLNLSGWLESKYILLQEELRPYHFYNIDTSEVPSRVWKGHTGIEIPTGVIGLNLYPFRIAMGRERLLYGRGLLISPNPFSLDILGGEIIRPPFHLSSFFSPLGNSRYLFSHRIDIISPYLKLGFSEVVISADSLCFDYLIPVIPYYLVQYNLRRDDNILWSIDATLLFKGLRFYGELLIDDYMYESTPAPNKLGFNIGMKFAYPSGIGGFLDYTFIDKWVYTHKKPQNSYTKEGMIIGDSLGPDADLLRLSLNYWILKNLYLITQVSYQRKGEGRVDEPYKGGDTNPPFPSGIVEHKTLLEIKIHYEPYWRAFLEPLIGWERIKNKGNIRGDNSEGFLAGIRLGCHL